MLKLMKWLSGVLFGLVMMTLLAIIIVPKVFDPNDYRQQISELVQQKTGRTLTLEGDLSVSVFPWLGVKTAGLSLSQPPQITGQMLSVEQAQLQVKLLPLLSKRVEIDTIILKQPTVNLITLPSGISSLTGLVEQTEETGVAEKDEAQAGAMAVALVVQGVDLQNANLLWDDQQAQQKYQIKHLSLKTGNLLANKLADVSLTGQFIDASQPEPINFDLQGQAKLDIESLQATAKAVKATVKQGEASADLLIDAIEASPKQMAVIQGMQINATTSQEALGDVVVAANIKQLSVNQQQQTATINELQTDITVAELADKPFALNSRIAQLNYRLDTNALALSSLNMTGKYHQRPFDLAIPTLSANLNQQTAQLTAMELNSNDAKVTIRDLLAKSLMDKPQVSGVLNVAPFNLRNLLQDLEIEFEPHSDSALQSVSMGTEFVAGVDSVSLHKLRVAMDNSLLTGRVSAQQFANPRVTFTLLLDEVNVDDYLLVADDIDIDNAEQTASSSSGAEALVVPMAIFKDMHANGSFKATQVTANKLTLNDIELTVQSTPGKVTITPNLNLYHGTSQGSVVYSEHAGQATLQITNSLQSVNLSELLTAAEVTEQLSGVGSLDIDVTVKEQNGEQSNQGTVTLLAKDGAVKGVDIKAILAKAQQYYNRTRGKQTDQGQSSDSDETRFAELSGTFNIKDFTVSNHDFSLQAPLFRVAGQGDIDLAQQTLDYLVSVSVVGSLQGQGGQSLEQLKGVTIPVRFKGELSSPRYSIDVKALYKAEAERKLKEKKAAYLNKKLGIDDGKKLSTKDALKGFLNKKIDDKYGTGSSSNNSASENSVDTPPSETEVLIDPLRSESEQSQPLTEAQQRKQAKEQLKNDLKNKLLEGLFK